MRWLSGFVAGVLLGGGGVALGVWLLASGDDPAAELPAPMIRDAAATAEVDRLENELEIERMQREGLSDEVARLEAELARARSAPAPEEKASDHPPGLDDAIAKETDRRAERDWFDEARLKGLPFRPDEVDRIREEWEQYTLARLYEQDRNARESGRSGAERIQAWRDIEANALEELGERGYDAMLWAAHAPNRVVVREVIDDSPAARAGIQPGDQILEYGDTRLWRPYELQTETKTGVLGERVMMTVLRDGEERRIDVPRGPLGVQVMGESQPPWPE